VEAGETVIGPFIRLINGFPTGDVVAESLHLGVFASVGATDMLVWDCRNGRELDLIGQHDVPDEILEMSLRLPVTITTPTCEAYRTGEPALRVFDDLSRNNLFYPDLPHTGRGAFVSAPIVLGGRSIGAFSFLRLENFADRDLDLGELSMVGELLGLWLLNRPTWVRSRPLPGEPQGAFALTERQQEILRLMERGLSSAEIAVELCYSLSTVKQEIVRMKRSIRASSSPELIEMVRSLSLLG